MVYIPVSLSLGFTALFKIKLRQKIVEIKGGTLLLLLLLLLFSTYALQPSRLIVRSGLDVPISPPGVSTRVTTREHPAAEGGTVGEKCPGILPKCRLTLYI